MSYGVLPWLFLKDFNSQVPHPANLTVWGGLTNLRCEKIKKENWDKSELGLYAYVSKAESLKKFCYLTRSRTEVI